MVSAVKSSIDNAYSQNVLPGLPYVELPVVAVSGGSHSVIADVVAMLDPKTTAQRANRKGRKGKGRMVEDSDDEANNTTHALVTHVHPTDCTTIMSAMKAIVTGFVDKQDGSTEENSVIQCTSGLLPQWACLTHSLLSTRSNEAKADDIARQFRHPSTRGVV